MELVLNLKEFRQLQKKYDLSMTELALKIGISRSHLWRIMRKQCKPGHQFIAGFKSAFPEEKLDKFFLTIVLQ